MISPTLDQELVYVCMYVCMYYVCVLGLGQFAFNDLRYDSNGQERTDFVLNQPNYRKASIIVAADNFGCGSSRVCMYVCMYVCMHWFMYVCMYVQTIG